MPKTTHEIKKIPNYINNLKELWFSEEEVRELLRNQSERMLDIIQK